MPNLSVHLQDSTVGELGGIAQAVARGSSIPHIGRMDVAVAYASVAGIDILERQLADAPGWLTWQKRFLLSIDFGTTEPAVFERVKRLPNSEVRIPRGLEVLQRPNLVPRVPFHSKMWAFYRDVGTGPLGLVIGSGNLTRSGMMTGGEVAVALTIADPATSAWPAGWRRTVEWFETTWGAADPADRIVSSYAEIVRTTAGFGLPPEDSTEAAQRRRTRVIPPDLVTQLHDADSLFVRVDRATRNRQERPGNQIDLPLGTSRFFHLPPREMVGVVGPIALRVAGYATVQRSVRVGANSMDKVNLPLPESVGIDTYDNSYLLFVRTSRRHTEAAVFDLMILNEVGLARAIESASGSVRLQMAGGRPYGLLFN